MTDPKCEQFITSLLSKMTTEEKVHLCHGNTSVTIGNIPRVGIPELGMVDGPQGVRLEDGRTSTALPCGIGLACSWDPDTAREYGALIGREVLAAGHHVILGPGFNMMRTPLNGRNFEYYGEDPVLAGEIAAGYIRGCQQEGAGATPKHLALNNQEICRTTGNSIIDERSLRELYLTAFEIVIKKGHPWMMMSSYNKINGTYASAAHLVQQQITKDEMGFDGVMVSDWGGAHDTKGCALGGLDLEMGQGMNSIMGEPLLKLVQDGEIPEDVIEEKARRVLRLMYRTNCFMKKEEQPKGEIDTPRHHKLVKKLAQDSMVLLKNDKNFLPLDSKKLKSIAVIGPSADYQHNTGPLEICGGSGAVHPAYDVTPLKGLQDYCKGRGIEVFYEPGVIFNNNAIIPRKLLSHEDKKPGLKAEYFEAGTEIKPDSVPSLTRIDQDMQLRWNNITMVGGSSNEKLPYKNFAVRWTGNLTADRTGKSSLMIDCIHSHVKIWLAGKLVIQTDPASRHSHGEYTFDAEAEQPLKLVIEMSCPAENPEMKLLWKTDSDDYSEKALAAAAKADAVIFCGGTNHFYDKEAIGWGDVPGADIPDLELIGPQSELISKLAKVNPKTAVVLINGSVVSVEDWLKEVPAILEAWYPGMETGNALAEILFGDVSPSGKLCCTWGKNLNDYACHSNGNYPGERKGENPYVKYDEGIFIGYRHFERAGIEPRFPFGFGMTYTSFKVNMVGTELLKASVKSPEVAVRIKVENTGKRDGAEVVQLYVRDNEASVEREKKALKAFRKIWLKAGESKEIELKLSLRDFAFWSPSLKKWTVEPGTFTLYAGNSSRDITGTAQITLK